MLEDFYIKLLLLLLPKVSILQEETIIIFIFYSSC